MLRVQQETINDLKVMITQLLTNRKKSSKDPKPNTSSSKSKEKQKQGESFSSDKTERENNFNSESPKSSSEEEDGTKNGARHSKQMNEFEKYLEAIANRSNLQEARIVQPYPVE